MNDAFIIINKFRKQFEIFVQVSVIKLISIILLTMKIINTEQAHNAIYFERKHYNLT